MRRLSYLLMLIFAVLIASNFTSKASENNQSDRLVRNKYDA
ncbi:hypothetical protein [Candidatus Odyssella thessalonicensis]|nr:hypothetical protein [Candidatus Odyssella thessalonicensis]